METKLAAISKIAKERPKERFTSLYHLLNEGMLLGCHRELSGNKAVGVDEVTKDEYEANLGENIKELVISLKNHSYKPQATKRVYIPKGNGKQRPLGIPSYEDKIVQLGLSKILQAIYEQDFLDISYGFRPMRSCHDAIKELGTIIQFNKVNYVVDADIKGFFDNVEHDWMMKFIDVRIADPNIKRLIVRFLKAGIMENGNLAESTVGTPQGAIISPLLANIYLHYTLDLWFEKKIKKVCRGEAYIVRYADDFVCCFQSKNEADEFYVALIERLRKFGLEIAQDKTKIIPFGRFAQEDLKAKGDKPETFDFLGFTHYCGTDREGKKFRVKRKTSRKKFVAKVKEFKVWIRSVRNLLTIHEIFVTVKKKLVGHYQYYGITDNCESLKQYKACIEGLLYKWLNRRSQRKSFTIEQFRKYLKFNPLPVARIYVNVLGLPKQYS